MITLNGNLIVGLERDGIQHRDFELRAATIEDVISAIEKAGPGVSHLKLRVFKAAEQMVERSRYRGETPLSKLIK